MGGAPRRGSRGGRGAGVQLRTHGADPGGGFGKKRGPRWDPRAGHSGFAEPKPLAEASCGSQTPLCPHRDVGGPAGRCGQEDQGVLQRGPSPRVGRGPCSSAAPAGGPGPGCRGRGARAGALPALAPSPPGTRINCSCFPSLTALLLAGTNCESPQGRTAHPARDVPPTPGLCYPEFRISCSRVGGSRLGGGCPGWSKEAVDMERGWSPFPLGTSGAAFHPPSLATSWGSRLSAPALGVLSEGWACCRNRCESRGQKPRQGWEPSGKEPPDPPCF